MTTSSTPCSRSRVAVEWSSRSLPAQAEQFAFAATGVESRFERGVQAVFVRGGEELPGFIDGERFEALGRGVLVRTVRATLGQISSSRTACSRADLSTEWR